MLSWEQFEKAAPEMASFGLSRMAERVMYLGTVRKDGTPGSTPSPRSSAPGTSSHSCIRLPKGHDLQRNGRYAIHSLVKDWNGSDGEFSITGKARPVEDEKTREIAAQGSPCAPKGEYVCFEFLVEECLTTHYVDGNPQYARWKESASKR